MFASQLHMLELDRFQAALKAQAAQAGVIYVDVTTLSYQVKDDLSLLAEDELHYSGKMYALWAAQILPIILKNDQP